MFKTAGRHRVPTQALSRVVVSIALLLTVGCSTEPAADVLTPDPVGDMATAPPALETVAEPMPSAEPEPPRLRVAWTRDVGDGTDVISFGDQLILMAYDSKDGQGERVVLDQPASYARPLITPDGATIVFSIRREASVYALDWNGSGLRRLADGFGLTVWTDPADATAWVYVGVDEAPTDPPSYRAVRRHRLDDPAVSELVWDAQPVSGDSFQLSADGRMAGALFPWPVAGVADLEAGTWRAVGEGCWTGFSPGGDPLVWYFDGSHRNLTIVDLARDERWRVPINEGLDFGGYEVYHPRWTNDPRALVLTGPYTVGGGANKIRGGGNQVEVYVGRFNDTLTAVASWERVTHNDVPDFYPDAWLEPGPRPAPRLARVGPGERPVTDGAARRLVVDARVRQEVILPTPTSIAPYREGLLGIEYDVVRVVEGQYDARVIVAAHWIIRDGQTLAGADRPRGGTYRLTLDPYDMRPELEGKRLVMDAEDLTLPLFYDFASAEP